MKSATVNRKKPDFLFIAVVLIFIAALTAVSFLAKQSESAVDPMPLPADEENNIHELVISEIMSNNDGVYVNSNNEATDYVEIYNGTGKTIKLDGYGLSDKVNTIKWAFSNTSIEPGQYLVVALTGKLEAGLNAPFKLSSKGQETVMLVNSSSKVIDAVDTVALSKNNAMMRDKDGNWFISEYGTPGYGNNEAGLQKYHDSLLAEGNSDIVVNELLVRLY